MIPFQNETHQTKENNNKVNLKCNICVYPQHLLRSYLLNACIVCSAKFGGLC